MSEAFNEINNIIITGTCLLLLVGGFLVSFVLLHNRKQRLNRIDKQNLQNLQAKFDEALLRSKVEIQERILQDISLDLHDNISQLASLVKINLNTLKLESSAESAQKLEFTKELCRRLIADLKMLSAGLRDDHVQSVGLLKAIELELEKINKLGVTQAHLTTQTNAISLPDNNATIAFRMVQEILHNSLKHAGAKNLEVSVQKKENCYILAIRDDGVGFQSGSLLPGSHSGLKNLQERAALIHASLEVHSKPGAGTDVQLKLSI